MTVNYQYADGVSQIKFDDGKANALSLEAITQLNAALDQALRDGGSRSSVARKVSSQPDFTWVN